MISLRSIAWAIGHSVKVKQRKEREAREAEAARLEAQRILDAPRLAHLRAIHEADARRAERWTAQHAQVVNEANEAALPIQAIDLMMMRRAQEERLFQAQKQAAEWEAEQQRREEAALDLDGSRAAARAARDEELEQQRLDFLTAQLARRAS